MNSHVDERFFGAACDFATREVIAFVWTFARFEYALKRDVRYLYGGDGDAKANWDRFGSDNNLRFEECFETGGIAAALVFLDEPPRKQLRLHGELHWSDPMHYTPPGPRFVWLLGCVRCVRNNLFHGGKFPEGPIVEPARNARLVLAAQTLLQQALKFDAAVESAFWGDLP